MLCLNEQSINCSNAGTVPTMARCSVAPNVGEMKSLIDTLCQDLSSC